MKKSLKIVLLSIISLALMGYMTSSYAATEEELISYLSKSFNVAGESVKIPSQYVKEAQRYVSTHDVTSDEADAIISKVDEGVNVLKEAGVSDISKLSQADKDKLIATAQSAAAVVDAKVTVTGGTITVTDSDGVKFGSYDLSSGKKYAQTGSDNMMVVYVMAGLVVFAIAGVVIYRRDK